MSRLIIALDVPTLEAALELSRRLAPLRPLFKVGYEAYFAYGPALLDGLAAQTLGAMLDLKLHDIPRTVAAAIRSLEHPAVEILTVHALGGETMMRSAADAVAEIPGRTGRPAPLLFGVTLLTSMSELELPELGFSGGIGENVVRLAAVARNAGCDGIVCSPHEVRELKAFFGTAFRTLCPGIRPAGAAAGDQRRIATPAQAAEFGADYIVVGRPVTQAADPLAAATAILDELKGTAAS